jgi:protoporphyrinogen oxidase
MTVPSATVLCIGAGPAGLTAAYLLSKKGVSVIVVEADPRYVGGISKTVEYKGFRFDVGGHRFFSKSQQVEDLWSEILPDDMLTRARSSRIYYNGQMFSYPLKAIEVPWKLGFLQSISCVASYLWVRLFPIPNPRNLQDWVSNQFGRRLFSIFFKTYTEKVWGIKCKDISADWGAQRIKGLSLGTAIVNALLPRKKPKNRRETIKTLIDSFRYPRKGPGMMWEAAAAKIVAQGGQILMGRKLVGLALKPEGGWQAQLQKEDGGVEAAECAHVISSMPIRELVAALSPAPSKACADAAQSLRYRDFITVALILKDTERFSDNWIYIHDPAVKVGRIQNFKSWSPELIPDPTFCCYGLEYFCFEGDDLWNLPDAGLIDLAKKEIAQLGFTSIADIVDGSVVRQRKAYPVYDDAYAAHIDTIKHEIEARYPNLHLVGRNGMHKYNNQDHAMMTSMLTVENILAGKQIYDVWRVNQDAEYQDK